MEGSARWWGVYRGGGGVCGRGWVHTCVLLLSACSRPRPAGRRRRGGEGAAAGRERMTKTERVDRRGGMVGSGDVLGPAPAVARSAHGGTRNQAGLAALGCLAGPLMLRSLPAAVRACRLAGVPQSSVPAALQACRLAGVPQSSVPAALSSVKSGCCSSGWEEPFTCSSSGGGGRRATGDVGKPGVPQGRRPACNRLHPAAVFKTKM